MTATENTQTRPPVKVGDIFYSSWGYDQTNVDWYQVVDVSKSGKTVTLVEIAADVEADNGPSVRTLPAVGVPVCAHCNTTQADPWMHHDETSPRFHPFKPNRMTRRPRPGWREGWAVTISECQTGFSWDGSSKHQTGSGYGH